MPKTIRCDPKLFEKDLTEQVVIVTGANSGIGFETAKQLIKQNATVILGCRSEEKGKKAEADLNACEGMTKGKAVFVTTMDLASLASIREFVTAFQSQYTRLDVLVNNAGIGVMASPYKTQDGFEILIGANHLGHFLLMRLLTPMLIQTAETYGKPSRFVALSSSAAAPMPVFQKTTPDIDFEDLNFEKREYDSWECYGQSKLANVLHAMEAGKRYPKEKLISASVHPGWVITNLDKHYTEATFGKGWFGNTIANALKTMFAWKGDAIYPVDGCQTTLHCVLEDDEKMESGKYYSQFGVYTKKECQKGGWPMEFPNENATSEKATKLWEVSEKLVGLSDAKEEK